MQYISETTNIKLFDKTIVILGNFDGIHIGHQKLFEVAKNLAKKKGLKTLLFSFFPHPTWVLGKDPKPLLMSREEKREKVEKLGIDIYVEYPFSYNFSQLSAIEFITEIFLKKLNGQTVVIGHNYFFGKNKEGNVAYMHQLGKKYKFEVHVVNEIKHNKITVSSTHIRDLILNGEIDLANKLLGHSYTVKGIVTKGKQIGRTLGFPTINIIPGKIKVLPPNGVYIMKVYLLGQAYDGIANVGYNPTVSGDVKKIETHIFNFSKDVYGEDAVVEFLAYIRPETKFNSLEELAAQLKKDKECALEYITIDLQRKIDMI